MCVWTQHTPEVIMSAQQYRLHVTTLVTDALCMLAYLGSRQLRYQPLQKFARPNTTHLHPLTCVEHDTAITTCDRSSPSWNSQLVCVPPHLVSQGLANLVWAMAAAGQHDRELLKAIVANCDHRLSSFDAQVSALRHPLYLGFLFAPAPCWTTVFIPLTCSTHRSPALPTCMIPSRCLMV